MRAQFIGCAARPANGAHGQAAEGPPWAADAPTLSRVGGPAGRVWDLRSGRSMMVLEGHVRMRAVPAPLSRAGAGAGRARVGPAQRAQHHGAGGPREDAAGARLLALRPPARVRQRGPQRARVGPAAAPLPAHAARPPLARVAGAPRLPGPRATSAPRRPSLRPQRARLSVLRRPPAYAAIPLHMALHETSNIVCCSLRAATSWPACAARFVQRATGGLLAWAQTPRVVLPAWRPSALTSPGARAGALRAQ